MVCWFATKVPVGDDADVSAWPERQHSHADDGAQCKRSTKEQGAYDELLVRGVRDKVLQCADAPFARLTLHAGVHFNVNT